MCVLPRIVSAQGFRINGNQLLGANGNNFITTYGSSVYLNAEDKIWNRLQIIQNKALRAALYLPHFTSATYIHKSTNIPFIRSYVTDLTKRALVRSQITEDEVTEQNITLLLDSQQQQ